nr:MAG: movement protein [Cape gooseberry ilarvirus 1]UEP18552.1 MAG: movement protein [Cape gooseberry ilarvirus 1]
MALAPTMKALTFSADDEESLQKSVLEALSGSIELNMGVRRCAAFPAKNDGAFLCELTTKETKSFVSKMSDKIKGRIFIDHAVIHLMYIPVILNTTHAVAYLKIKNMATGDELYGGTKVDLSEAFILTLTWPRSLFADAVAQHKGLYLGGSVECSSSVPRNADIGMWYPLWSEKVSNKQLYSKTTDIVNTRALETFTKTMIHSDKEMRSLLRSRASTEIAAKRREPSVMAKPTIDLMGGQITGVDFTKKTIREESLPTNPNEVTVLEPKMVPLEHAVGTEKIDNAGLDPTGRNLLEA